MCSVIIGIDVVWTTITLGSEF